VKVFIPDQILAEWFVKSLLPKITEDVAKAGVVTEEQVIAQAQYLDLVYTQSGTLHEKIPDLPKSNQIAAAPSGSHAADGMIGTVNTKSKKKSSKASTTPIITLPDSPTGESSSPELTADIHAVDSSTAKSKSGGKKKGKKKAKADKAQKEKTEKSETSDKKRKPKYPCLICEEDHFTRDCPHRAEVVKIVKGSSTPAVLKDPFPKQETKMIGSSSGASEEPILMMSHVRIATRSQDYGSKSPIDGKEAESSHSNPSTSASGSDPLQIEKPNPDLVIKPPAKGILRKSAFNPHARAAQNYNIVEDLAVSPSAMSALEVLQSCPAQRELLLSAIGAVDIQDPNLMIFDLENSTPRLPHQMAFQIPVIVKNKPIHRTVIDEGASTCIMSIQCWRSLGSPTLNQSPTILKAFDGRGFHPFGILQDLPIGVEGKTVSLDVEVVDAPLDYNLLLGRSWSYAMTAVISSVFRVIKFPYNGKIVTIDQLTYFSSDPASSESIQHVDKKIIPYKDVGVGLVKDSGLLGTFHFLSINADPSFATIHMITSDNIIYDDPWIVPSETEIDSFGNSMPLSPYELAYEAVVSFSDKSSTQIDQMNVVGEEPLFTSTSERITFPEVVSSDEQLREILSVDDLPWEDLHHRSSFLHENDDFEKDFSSIFTTEYVSDAHNPMKHPDSELNLANISRTIAIDISVKTGTIENIHIGASCTDDEIRNYKALFQEFRDVFAWSYEEMPGIDSSIVVHEIKTYPDAKPVRQRLRQIHPRKAAAIKAEVEKLLKAGFIYPIPLTDWVSNIVPVNKKQGTIRICIDYRDINRACPKDNYPTPYIDQIIDDCEIFSFMDGFSGYNQINILPADQPKTAFICPWGTFAYFKLPFGLKNAGATFQRAMSYAFHDIKHIVQPYLDDLPAHSLQRADHPVHLRAIFMRCRHYRIRLNPHKCVFCIEVGRLLGFVVSKAGIRVDPSKVEAIVHLPPPSSLRQLQSLQGKANFLRRFIPNYAEITKGFTRLLKQNVQYFWDEIAQKSFDALKHALTHAPLLHPPNYNQDYLLYLAASHSTIGMVLVQEDEFGTEHVIYYLSRTLNPTELKYSHVEKLALAAVQAVQRFRHYILLRKTTVISDCNPMTYILTKQLLGGKYSKWIVILQEFDLEFEKSKSKKSLVFAELMCDFPYTDTETVVEEPIADESLFLISTLDPWFGDIIIYLQTQTFRPDASKAERRKIRFQSQQYRIIGDTLYRRGADLVFRRCLTHEEAEKVLNDCHSGACGGHMSGYATAQKVLRAGYFWPSMFKDCIIAVRKCHNCQVFDRKMRAPPAPLHPIIAVGPFAKWGIDFITCNPHSAGGHAYIILAVDYFTKWAEAMPTFDASGKTAAVFVFNHIITRFGVPQAIITDHGSHFRNIMMTELTSQLGLRHDSSTPYYPQANGLVESINKVLVIMIRRIIGIHRTNWHNMLFSALWAYRTSVKNSTGFTPFQLVYGLEVVLPIECEIPSLQMAVELLPATSEEEKRFLYLAKLDETRRDATLAIETHAKRMKAQYDKNVTPRSFSEGDLVLLYDQANDKLGAGKFVPMWHGPYIVKRKLAKGAYELVDFDGDSLGKPRNGLYLKRYYA